MSSHTFHQKLGHCFCCKRNSQRRTATATCCLKALSHSRKATSQLLSAALLLIKCSSSRKQLNYNYQHEKTHNPLFRTSELAGSPRLRRKDETQWQRDDSCGKTPLTVHTAGVEWELSGPFELSKSTSTEAILSCVHAGDPLWGSSVPRWFCSTCCRSTSCALAAHKLETPSLPLPQWQTLRAVSALQNVDMPFPGLTLHSAFQDENSTVAKSTLLLQYIQYLHECIPYAPFNAQHQAAAQQSFPQFISSSSISWCSCIVGWEQMPQASSPSH